MSEVRPSESQKVDPSDDGVSRRSFLRAGAAGVAAVLTVRATSRVSIAQPATPTEDPAAGDLPITLTINGQIHSLKIDPRTTLLDCLRERVDLTGTKKGCDHGQCGACTVHVEGRRVLSCLTLAAVVDGLKIITIEGLGTPDNLHPMQAAFLKCDGYQCGYCTSGQIMSATALLHEPCGPKDEDVKELMSGNICRCGAYPNIIAAIQSVRQNPTHS